MKSINDQKKYEQAKKINEFLETMSEKETQIYLSRIFIKKTPNTRDTNND